jgi:hypothetical protein
MKKFRVSHIVLCKVHVWRTIAADSYEDALCQAAAIECITDTSNGADFEIVDDEAVKQITIKEIQS